MIEGWKIVKLTDISENLDYMRVPITKNVREVGKYPYYGASGIVDYVNNYIYDEDLLLISEDGANLLARATPIAFSVSGKIWVNNHAHVLRFKSLTTQKFVEYYIAGFNIKPYVTGMAQPKLNQRALEKIKLPLPSLKEQHRIVSILDASFEKIDALKKNAEENLKNAKALFQQVLAQELKQKEGCEMVKLGDVCELKSGNSSANDSNDGHLAYVKVSDLNLEENKNCIVTSTKFVDRQQNLKNIFPVGSVIFPKRGGAILTNKKRLISIEVCCDLNIMGVIPCTNLDSHYLFYYFQGLNLGKISSGTTIPQINNKDVSPLLIPLPVIEEQHRIVRTLDTLSEKCRRLETIAQQTIRECDALKQSILRQAFSGEL